MSFHNAGQFARQSLGNAKINQNYPNHNIREEDIISSIDPSIVLYLFLLIYIKKSGNGEKRKRH
jgi:hypothetical protein